MDGGGMDHNAFGHLAVSPKPKKWIPLKKGPLQLKIPTTINLRLRISDNIILHQHAQHWPWTLSRLRQGGAPPCLVRIRVHGQC